MSCNSSTELNCQDPYSAIIHAILQLKESNGSSVDDITSKLEEICESGLWDNDTVQTNIDLMLKRGLLIRSSDSADHYLVNGNMARVNNKNKKYFCICLFYK